MTVSEFGIHFVGEQDPSTNNTMIQNKYKNETACMWLIGVYKLATQFMCINDKNCISYEVGYETQYNQMKYKSSTPDMCMQNHSKSDERVHMPCHVFDSYVNILTVQFCYKK